MHSPVALPHADLHRGSPAPNPQPDDQPPKSGSHPPTLTPPPMITLPYSWPSPAPRLPVQYLIPSHPIKADERTRSAVSAICEVTTTSLSPTYPTPTSSHSFRPHHATTAEPERNQGIKESRKKERTKLKPPFPLSNTRPRTRMLIGFSPASLILPSPGPECFGSVLSILGIQRRRRRGRFLFGTWDLAFCGCHCARVGVILQYSTVSHSLCADESAGAPKREAGYCVLVITVLTVLYCGTVVV